VRTKLAVLLLAACASTPSTPANQPAANTPSQLRPTLADTADPAAKELIPLRDRLCGCVDHHDVDCTRQALDAIDKYANEHEPDPANPNPPMSDDQSKVTGQLAKCQQTGMELAGIKVP
jgi:hypothetical protein